ncbi:hypothetical protein TanjilG_20605 [Lupinus angustifolius]|uniref:Uncharacterized protein n=1 Tax=Lupinus angustifolius TaxID=3871 RepID=A0A4P1QRB1_LUPAN|nr:PREDICTED: uncharacterized protein LOC109332408 [Lupinus angustifolius]OIV92943.1 hypothetical protein TanjilG_20605 [Lupinus angustifolius]
MANQDEEEIKKLFSSYIGLIFSVFLALLPNNLHSHVRDLTVKLYNAEEELREMKYRRQEDSKANARVVEIFASHRNAWQAEEKRLLMLVEAAEEEVGRMRERVAEMEKEGLGGWRSRECYGVEKSENVEEEVVYQLEHQEYYQKLVNNGFDSEFLASASSNLWAHKSSLYQDVQYESRESVYNTKHFVARRESPWKVDGGDSAGVSSKLKLLEHELLNLEKVGKNDLSKVSSLIKKQAKRYEALSETIDDLCRRIAIDPSEPSINSEFRTQTQIELLLEAFRLQQGASETGQKLMELQAEFGKSHYNDEVRGETTVTRKRSLDSIKNNFKEVQRNLEIWLARIIGDLEGILARDGATRVREYYISRYPFVQ